jgi:hypothetical protein
MYIKRIELAGFSAPSPDGGTDGAVVLITDAGERMQIPLTLPHRLEMQRSRHRLLVLAEALKKARRVPSLRAPGKLRFAPGLLPPELRRM